MNSEPRKPGLEWPRRVAAWGPGVALPAPPRPARMGRAVVGISILNAGPPVGPARVAWHCRDPGVTLWSGTGVQKRSGPVTTPPR